MIVTGQPQFSTQDNRGSGNGIPAVPEWLIEHTNTGHAELLAQETIDTDVMDVFIRLRKIFQDAKIERLCNTKLHDLACFAIHRLLHQKPDTETSATPTSECLRYGIMVYLFTLQGSTYYSHEVILSNLMEGLSSNFEQLWDTANIHGSFYTWLATVGMMASVGTPRHFTWTNKAKAVAETWNLEERGACENVRKILWLENDEANQLLTHLWRLAADTDSVMITGATKGAASGLMI